MGGDNPKQQQEVIEIKGWLWEQPPDVWEALGNPALSDCLLFQLSKLPWELGFRHFSRLFENLEEWEQTFRVERNLDSKEGEERKTVDRNTTCHGALDNLQQQGSSYTAPQPLLRDPNRVVLFVEEVRCSSIEQVKSGAGGSKANTESREAPEPVQDSMKGGLIKFPAAHLVFNRDGASSCEMRKLVEHLDGSGVVTLGLGLEEVVHTTSLLKAWPALSYLLILPSYERPHATLSYLEKVCLSLPRLEGLAFWCAPSPDKDLTSPPMWLSKLGYLNVSTRGQSFTPLRAGIWSDCTRLRKLRLAGTVEHYSLWRQHLQTSVFQSGSLTCLDLTDFLFDGEWPLKELLQYCFSDETTSSIVDLGLQVERESSVRLLVNSNALSKLLVLRLMYADAGAVLSSSGLLAGALSQPTCQVRFLDLDFGKINGLLTDMAGLRSQLWSLLLRNIRERSTPHPLQAVRFLPQSFVQVQGGLADWLRSPACSLVWLDFGGLAFSTTFDNEEEERELANSLTNNFSVCTLSARWRSIPARAHANSLIRRNGVYTAGQLLEEQVQPTSAKLFLCGHEGVGKTTLCRSMVRAQRSVTAHPLARCGLHLANIIAGTPDRTRGMEFHSLKFGEERKLVICDLGGQDGFHAFHHYFVTASDNDLFVVVCKFAESSQQDVFRGQLEYWLRYIVSHRSATDSTISNGAASNHADDHNSSPSSSKPKVIVVVNFFYPEDPHLARAKAAGNTRAIMTKFSAELDFGAHPTGPGEPYPNLFALAAPKVCQVAALRTRLQSLLEENLQSGHRSLKLCNDISAKVLPSLIVSTRKAFPSCGWWASMLAGRRRSAADEGVMLFVPFSKVLERYCQMFPTALSPESLAPRPQRLEAALQDLHNKGELVYFPAQGSAQKATASTGQVSGSALPREHAGSLVITDSRWFCSKLVGSLLATRLQSPFRSAQSTRQPWLWKIEDINNLLRDQGCKEEHLGEIIQYLQNLDLCYPQLEDNNTSAEQATTWMLLFPAVLQGRKKIQYPQVVSATTSGGGGVQIEIFFGRRLRCEESSLHLIPSGVFTMLQVRLQRLGDNEAYDLGDGWASLRRGSVAAVVRFGGDGNEDWHNKQWIDILIFIPTSGNPQHAARNSARLLAGDRLMTEIQSLIHDLCQAADRGGIPRVHLQEWILESRESSPPAPAIKHSTLWKRVREEGLEGCDVAWSAAVPATPAVDLLLPKELQELVNNQLAALESIKKEFWLAGGADEDEQITAKGKDPESSISESTESDADEHRKLWRLIKERLDGVDRGLRSIKESLQLIRQDIGRLGEYFRQAERSIIANCSTRLLRNELMQQRAYPLYPYLVDEQGRFKALRSLFRTRARLRFMCESSTDGPHPVEGQTGKMVTIKTEKWLVRMARIMVPAFRVICCLARLAATVYLPASLVFIPSPDCLAALGIGAAALQQQILPKALEALLSQIPDIDPSILSSQAGQKEDVKTAIQGILENETIDMATDFSLFRIRIDRHDEARWVCHKHLGEGKQLQGISNPFK